GDEGETKYGDGFSKGGLWWSRSGGKGAVVT
ncbi:hypothetical protein A2U01_0051487, partial [Trifolium medium]|nr:hypothetical protein [Trifolium medium]